MVTTLPQVTKAYKVSFEVKITSILKKDTNILQCTVGKSSGPYGTRTPAVFLREGRLLFRSAVNGVSGWGYKVNSAAKYKIGEWVLIEISQIQETRGFNYTVTINGKQEHTTINNQPEAFNEVKCYASNPWKPAQPGVIRNLFFYIKNN